MTLAVLTPSEVVLLNGSRFAGKPGFLDKWKVLGTDTEVSRRELVLNAYAAALLAGDAAGDLRLEVRGKKALLGLRTVQTLYAEPGTATAWPAGCVEGAFRSWAERLRVKNRHQLVDILDAWQETDVTSPEDRALNLINQGLATRGLLQVIEEKKLKVFTVRRYALPESTAALAQAAAGEVEALLKKCQQERPELWRLLTSHIALALKRRIEQQDSGDD